MASVFTLAIIGLFCSLFIPVWGCKVTFLNTKVTLGGARDVKTVTGCFSPTDEFIKVSYIQIINENITALKRNAISGLPKLVDVIIDTSNITDLESGCFSDLPQLYLIKLRHNNFKTVREGVFNKLTLIELCLSNNSIETIHPKAFNDIPNLKILQLDQNKLSYWSGEWFLGSPKISVLNFEYNLITNLPTAAFQNINGLHYDAQVNLNVSTNVYLNNNKMRYLSDGAFNGIENLGWLFLHKNELEEISEASLGTLRSADWIRLEHNNLKCIPRRLVDISPKVLWYISNNPLTAECKNWYESIRSNMNSQ